MGIRDLPMPIDFAADEIECDTCGEPITNRTGGVPISRLSTYPPVWIWLCVSCHRDETAGRMKGATDADI